MWVTCYTDASFASPSPGRRGGGHWAVWLRSSQGRVVRSGACPEFVRTSTNAELAAIEAGVHLAIETWGGRVTVIDLHSDCLAAMAIAEGTGRARSRAAERLQRRIQRLLTRNDVELRCRWVKAHQPSSASTAAFHNNECDRLARDRRRR